MENIKIDWRATLNCLHIAIVGDYILSVRGNPRGRLRPGETPRSGWRRNRLLDGRTSKVTWKIEDGKGCSVMVTDGEAATMAKAKSDCVKAFKNSLTS